MNIDKSRVRLDKRLKVLLCDLNNKKSRRRSEMYQIKTAGHRDHRWYQTTSEDLESQRARRPGPAAKPS